MTQLHCLELVTEVAVEKVPDWIIAAVPSRGGQTPRRLDDAVDAMAKIACDLNCAVTFLVGQSDRLTGADAVREWAAMTSRMATVMLVKRGRATRDIRLTVIKTVFDERPDPLRLRFDGDVPEIVSEAPLPPRTRLDRAAAYLEEQLMRGPRTALEIIEQASDRYGISPRTLRRAKREFAVKSFNEAGRWWWIAT